MMKRLVTLLSALLALALPAAAEVYEGTAVALSSVAVASDVAGVAQSPDVAVGQRVEAGQRLAALAPEKTFAAQDGTVALILADEGDAVDGEVLAVMPLERYTVHCTVDKAYQSAESTLVHSGETVYAKCTSDGTHRAVGVVTQIDGAEYRVLTVGGELYVGETVYLYRDAAFTAAQRVGIGTVVVSDPQAYEASGELTMLRVAEGDPVERGQLLYATGGGEIASPVDGVVTSLACQAGDAVQKGQTVAEIVPDGEIGVEFMADEAAAASIGIGCGVRLIPAGREEEDAVPGTVVSVSRISDSGQYAVRVRPEAGAAFSIGMSVQVRTD